TCCTSAACEPSRGRAGKRSKPSRSPPGNDAAPSRSRWLIASYSSRRRCHGPAPGADRAAARVTPRRSAKDLPGSLTGAGLLIAPREALVYTDVEICPAVLQQTDSPHDSILDHRHRLRPVRAAAVRGTAAPLGRVA